jgi:hypothetical protein
MNETLTLEREGAKVKKRTRSYIRYKKVEKAIADATDNGRCWWLEIYLRNTIKY